MKKILTALLIMCMTSGCACIHQSDASGAHAPYTLESAAGYLRSGDYGKAIESYSGLIREDPSNAVYYLGRAQAYAASGEDKKTLEAAEADYRKALELDDSMPEAYIGLARVYMQQDDMDSAAGILVEGITVFTGQAGVDALENIQRLQSELEQLSSGQGETAAAEAGDPGAKQPAKAGQTKNLSISGITFDFNSNDAVPEEGIAGTMGINFTVEGPENVADVRIAHFGEEIYDAESGAYDMARVWREDEPEGLQEAQAVPFEDGCGFPAREEDLGKTMLVVLVGIDADINVVGYTVVSVPVSR